MEDPNLPAKERQDQYRIQKEGYIHSSTVGLVVGIASLSALPGYTTSVCVLRVVELSFLFLQEKEMTVQSEKKDLPSPVVSIIL